MRAKGFGMTRARVGLWGSALISVLVVAASCGSPGRQPQSAAPTTTASAGGDTPASPASTDTATSTTTPVADEASLVGRVLLDDATAAGVCDSVVNDSEPPGLPPVTTTTTTIGDSPQAASGEETASPGAVSISGSGLAVFSCTPQSAGGQASGDEFVVGFDLYSRTVKWTVDVASYSNFGVGLDHLFLVHISTTPPSGMNSGTTSYSLTAKSLDTGDTSWTEALPVTNTGNSDSGNFYGNNSLEPVEGPSGDPAHPEDVVLDYFGTSAFDSSTGKLLWHTRNDYNTEASGSYTGYGIVEVDVYQGQWAGGRTGENASNGSQLWSFPYPDVCQADFSNSPWGDQLEGNVEWLFGRNCYFAFNYQTGKTVALGAVPPTWTDKDNGSYVASPDGALVADGTHLSFYRWPNTTRPVWSLPANDVTPLTIGTSRVLVQGATQPLFLSTRDGSNAGSLDPSQSPPDGLVDHGLLVQEDLVIDVG